MTYIFSRFGAVHECDRDRQIRTIASSVKIRLRIKVDCYLQRIMKKALRGDANSARWL